MKKLINIIAGLIAGVAPFVIAVIIGVLIYNELQNLAGIIICVILGLLAVWVGIRIFQKIQRNGFFDSMTVVYTSNTTSKKSYYKTYVVTKNKIKTETNIDWTKQKSDATIGQDALILFN